MGVHIDDKATHDEVLSKSSDGHRAPRSDRSMSPPTHPQPVVHNFEMDLRSTALNKAIQSFSAEPLIGRPHSDYVERAATFLAFLLSGK